MLKNFYFWLIFIACYIVSITDAKGLTFIKDDEIESLLYEISTPILVAAGLPADSVKLRVIQDSSLNAFVLDRSYIFLNTGLLTQVPSLEALAGVIAHEVGHIAEGHTIQRHEDIVDLTRFQVLSGLTAIIAGVATQDPKIALGAILGTPHASQMRFLAYSRVQEYAADQAANKYLARLGVPITGFIDLLKRLYTNERVFDYAQNTYYLTHPLSQDRIKSLQGSKCKVKNSYLTPELKKRYALVVAKINAFTLPCGRVLKLYHHPSEESHYAEAIFHYRQGYIAKALAMASKLISAHPKNPYYYELKADLLYSKGDAQQAIKDYRSALGLLKAKHPTVNSIKLQLIKTLIAASHIDNLKDAIILSEQLLEADNMNAEAWKQLSIAYSKSEEHYLSNLALAKNAILEADRTLAKKLIAVAEKKKASVNSKKSAEKLGIQPADLRTELEAQS